MVEHMQSTSRRLGIKAGVRGLVFVVRYRPHYSAGIFAKEHIPAHTFIGAYAGELITDVESEARGR